MARIHQLQHEDQMQLAAARQATLKAKARARMWGLLALLLAVVAAALAAVVLLRRRVAVARQAELEAFPPVAPEPCLAHRRGRQVLLPCGHARAQSCDGQHLRYSPLVGGGAQAAHEKETR